MKLDVQPLIALCDEKVDIRVTDLPPFEKVTINAAMNLPWAEDVKYESSACFTADSDGNLDLSKQKPDSGSYNFVDSMGLIVSMKSKDPNAIKKIGKNISIGKSLFIDISVQCQQGQANARLERVFKAKEVKTQRISDEFVGELFYSDNPNNKTIVLFGGSGAELSIQSPIASLLASHGFNVLSLAYFKEKGLPAQLSGIPLEYFERVFIWLSENPITSGKGINLYGVSKGGELALLLASRYPLIAKVAAFAPHAYCFQGLALFKTVSSWTLGGKSLPFIHLKARWLLADIIRCFIKNKPFGFTQTYKKALDKAKNKEDARIKIEDSNADLLLFAGKQNNMWNTYDGCIKIIDTLQKRSYRHSFELFVYENAGEPPLPAPYIIPPGENALKIAPRLVLSTGGTLEGNATAEADSWFKTIEFFRK
jgi:pimeloyl-ACP methyl ester carboxylesterase